ncbi:MAG TPA: hypothetical protein PKC88_06925, partial [Plasticicumulans sp.]|nr:hypothetical protein [Plasticicumulans sp.]
AQSGVTNHGPDGSLSGAPGQKFIGKVSTHRSSHFCSTLATRKCSRGPFSGYFPAKAQNTRC